MALRFQLSRILPISLIGTNLSPYSDMHAVIADSKSAETAKEAHSMMDVCLHHEG